MHIYIHIYTHTLTYIFIYIHLSNTKAMVCVCTQTHTRFVQKVFSHLIFMKKIACGDSKKKKKNDKINWKNVAVPGSSLTESKNGTCLKKGVSRR